MNYKDVIEYLIPHQKLYIDKYPYLLYKNTIIWQKDDVIIIKYRCPEKLASIDKIIRSRLKLYKILYSSIIDANCNKHAMLLSNSYYIHNKTSIFSLYTNHIIFCF